jgi:5S rRNA maturation endonuclease (ribonuclease M5)
MSTAAEVAAALGGRATTTGWIARCPCHRDRVPSLSISEGAGGIVLLHCHAGCSQKALVAEVRHRGFTLDGRPLPTRRVTATYDYRDENGNLIYQVQRWAPKEFRQRRPDGKDGWINNIDGVVRLPYRLPRMLASAEKPVFIVEGEKDADRLTQAGLVATTNSGGASASRSWSSMAQWFKDRRVVILPDNDEAGRRHASAIAEALRDIAKSIKIVRLPNLPAKGDVSDWLEAGRTIKELRQLAHATREWLGGRGRPADGAEEAAGETDIEDEIGRLATLTEIAYDRERKDAATRLGIRTSTLDKRVAEARSLTAESDGSGAEQHLGIPIVEPWPEPVDGAELLAEIVSTIRRYVAMNDHSADAAALWVLHTHALDAAYITARLSINSPEMRCGKSTLLDVLKTMVARPLSTANISTAALFRVLEVVHPTLLIDEVDSFLRNDDERRGIIDAGHCRASATVLRCVGDNNDVKPFAVWGAIALAGIGQLPGTITDRSITISLRRKRADEHVERLRLDRLEMLRPLGRRAARWVKDYLDELKDADPEVSAELHDRAADNWRPLIAIADTAGGPWSRRARQAAVTLTTAMETDEASIRMMLLADLRAMFENADALPSSEIVDRLARLEERPWAEIAGGKPISKNRLARLLKPFNVKPSQTWIDGKNQKSYRRADLEDAFARYLPAATARPLEALGSAGFEANETDRREQFLSIADTEKASKSMGSSGLAVAQRGAAGDKQRWRAAIRRQVQRDRVERATVQSEYDLN